MRENPTEPSPRPKTLDEYTTEQKEVADPQVLAKAIVEDPGVRDDAAKSAQEELTTFGQLATTIWQRRGKLDPQLHTRLRSDLMAIAWEIELLMELGHHDEETRARILLAFLLLPPDDDDDESEPEPEPSPQGDLVPA